MKLTELSMHFLPEAATRFWNSLFGQYGQTGFGNEFGSEHTAAPFVQPGAPTSPSAFDQPPEYHAQLTLAEVSSSPMVVPCSGGSLKSVSDVAAVGWFVGWMVFTA